MKTGIELITEERKEQIGEHGFTVEHDKDHNDSSLSWNAAVLASPIILFHKQDFANTVSFGKAEVDKDWKLPSPNYKPHRSNVITNNEDLPKKERVKQLKVAGALIAAEIDRIQAK